MAGNAAKQRNSSAAPNRLLQVLTIFIGVSSSTFTNPWGAPRQSRAENGASARGPIPIRTGYSRCVPNAAVREEKDESHRKTAIWWQIPPDCSLIERQNAQFEGN